MVRTLARPARVVLALLVVAGLQLIVAGPAHAAPGVEVSKTSDLAPKGEPVTVRGSGFQPDVTLFVVACDPAVANGGACDMANFAQAKTDASGAFEADLKLVASFGTTDCLTTPCAVMTSKVGDGGDRSQETAVPIAFTGGVALPEETTEPSPSATESSAEDSSKDASAAADDDSGSSTPILLGGGAVVALLLAAGALYFRRNRSAA